MSFLFQGILFLLPFQPQNQEQQEVLQDRIRWQLERCDIIGGVVLIEDFSRGWSYSRLLSEYLVEEDVPSLFTFGQSDLLAASLPDRRRCEHLFNDSLASLTALQSSTMTTRSTACPVISACCLDSFLTPYVDIGKELSFSFSFSFSSSNPLSLDADKGIHADNLFVVFSDNSR